MKLRIIEILKDILLIALLGSALYLLVLANESMSVSSAFLSIFTSGSSVQETETVKTSAAVRPVKLAVMTDIGRYGVMYGDDAMDTVYTSFGPLLGEALGTAGNFYESDGEAMQAALSGRGVYFEYPSKTPLSAIAEWLGTGFAADDLSAFGILLSLADDGVVVIYFIDSSGIYAAQTAVDPQTVLLDIVGYRPNDVNFAFELALQYPQFEGIDPFTLISDNVSLPLVSYESPLPATRDAVVTALGFNPYTDASFTGTDGAESFISSSSSLTIHNDGTVVFRNKSAAAQRFTVQSSHDTPTLAEIIETVRALIANIGAGGGGELMMTGFNMDENGCYDIFFDYFISGAKVSISSGHAVTARIEDGILTEFDIILKQYIIDERRESLMPAVQAAVVVSGSLSAEYADNGQGQVKAGWKS